MEVQAYPTGPNQDVILALHAYLTAVMQRGRFDLMLERALLAARVPWIFRRLLQFERAVEKQAAADDAFFAVLQAVLAKYARRSDGMIMQSRVDEAHREMPQYQIDKNAMRSRHDELVHFVLAFAAAPVRDAPEPYPPLPAASPIAPETVVDFRPVNRRAASIRNPAELAGVLLATRAVCGAWTLNEQEASWAATVVIDPRLPYQKAVAAAVEKCRLRFTSPETYNPDDAMKAILEVQGQVSAHVSRVLDHEFELSLGGDDASAASAGEDNDD